MPISRSRHFGETITTQRFSYRVRGISLLLINFINGVVCFSPFCSRRIRSFAFAAFHHDNGHRTDASHRQAIVTCLPGLAESLSLPTKKKCHRVPLFRASRLKEFNFLPAPTINLPDHSPRLGWEDAAAITCGCGCQANRLPC